MAESTRPGRKLRDSLENAIRAPVYTGDPNGAAALMRAGKGAEALRAAVATNAEAYAQELAQVLADIRAGGATSLRTMAAALNAGGMLTRRGGVWQVSHVRNLLQRMI